MSTESVSYPMAAAQQLSYPMAAAAASTPYFPVPFHLQNAYYSLFPTPSPATAYNAVYPMPQIQQAQQLFQKDAQSLTPEALASVKAAIASSEKDRKVEAKKKAVPRKAGGQTWEDPTLADWPEVV